MKKSMVLAAALLALSFSATATSYYACPEPDPGASENPGYCLSPSLAGTIEDALEMARAQNTGKDEVVLLDGVYNAKWDRDGLMVEPGLTVRSFSGDATRCILDGGGIDGERRAFCYLRTNATIQAFSDCAVSNLTFRNFFLSRFVETYAGNTCGAAIWAQNDYGKTINLQVDGCAFLTNTCGQLGGTSEVAIGGAIYIACSQGRAIINNSHFWGNRACSGSSAIHVDNGKSAISDCDFVGNIVSNMVSSNWQMVPVIQGSSGETTLSNCVFRGNLGCSKKYCRAGAIAYCNSYRCEFYGNLAYRTGDIFGNGGLGSEIYSGKHIEPLVDWAEMPLEKFCPQGVIYGARIYRGQVRNLAFNGTVFRGEDSSAKCWFYNTLFQDISCGHFNGVGEFVNCTFAHVYVGTGNWGAQFINGAKVINSLMVDCATGSGYLVGWTGGKPYHYTDGANIISNTVYYGLPYKDWEGDATHHYNNFAFTNAPPTEYKFVGSGDHPYAMVKDSFGIDRGQFVKGMLDRQDPMYLDLRGRRRVSNGTPDVGCYEYAVKTGFAVRVR